MKAALFLALSCAACATQGGEDGGDDNLPDRGINGWEKDPAEAGAPPPYVLTEAGATLGGSSALVVGQRLWIYGQRETVNGVELFRAEGDLTGAAFDAPVGLGIAGRDPSVVADDDGFWLAYVDAQGALRMARSSDGLAFEDLEVTGISADRHAPSLVLDGARVRLYLAAGDRIVHTEATRDALAFGPESEVLAPGTDCVKLNGDPVACWDESAILEAEVRRATTATGAIVYRMFYVGSAGNDADLGFAASYDGLVFTRFPYNPVLTGAFDEAAPSEVIAAGRYLLFWSEARSSTSAGILRAVHQPSAPSDRW